jgi:F0F1-type ATP synthase assembly protein I
MEKPDTKPTETFNLWGVAGEVGILIAVPLIVFLLIGIKLDQKLGTTPWLMLGGLALAGVVSTIAVARKVRAVSQMGNK